MKKLGFLVKPYYKVVDIARTDSDLEGGNH